MKHFVKLSNGETVVLIEEENSLAIALGDANIEGEIDLYVAQITMDGVLAYSTATYAPETISRGLKYEHI
jgi:hypothetical protein